MPMVAMINPVRRNAKGHFVKATAKVKTKVKPKARVEHKTRARAAHAPHGALVIDMGGRHGLRKPQRGTYTVNPVKHKRKKPAAMAATKKPARRRHSGSFFRKNPIGGMAATLKDALLPAIIFPAAAIGTDLVAGLIPLPAILRSGLWKPVAKMGVGVGLGLLAAMMLPRRIGSLVVGGALGGVLYDSAKGWLMTSFPTLPLSGMGDYPALDFSTAPAIAGQPPAYLGNEAPSYLGDMGAFIKPSNVGNFLTND